jgi:hypothetical protein
MKSIHPTTRWYTWYRGVCYVAWVGTCDAPHGQASEARISSHWPAINPRNHHSPHPLTVNLHSLYIFGLWVILRFILKRVLRFIARSPSLRRKQRFAQRGNGFFPRTETHVSHTCRGLSPRIQFTTVPSYSTEKCKQRIRVLSSEGHTLTKFSSVSDMRPESV